MKFSDSVSTLEGIGPKKTAAFEAVGIRTIEDLLWFFPKHYEDRNERGSLSRETDHPVTVRAMVVKTGKIERFRKGMTLFVLPVEEIASDGRVIRGEAIWFNQPWLASAFQVGQWYYFFGKISFKGNKRRILMPHFAPITSADAFFALRPVYGSVEGISSERLGKLVGKVLDDIEAIPDAMPSDLLKEYDLPALSRVLNYSHRPQNKAEVTEAKKRLKFEEALKINLGIQSNRKGSQFSKIHIHNFSQLKRFETGLPFDLTKGQIRVLEDIIEDLKSGKTMNRLILGDVGSGKTVVAAACVFLFALAGYQSAYMAPTEILAEQHAETFRSFLKDYDIPVLLLTGSVPSAKRREILADIANGRAGVIIGTHALIQSDVRYYNLGLVITDEQHRFGVRQRGRLGLKGTAPHTLVMSATPIPRTLSLVFYGDLDISTIDTMPKGRKPVKTYFYGEKKLPQIYDFIKKELDKGYQAFVVCPFVEASAMMEGVRDTERVYEEVVEYFGDGTTVGCLHGRLSESDKTSVIGAFSRKEIQLLVATSIIEVGIDVPSVSVMVILSADRFGLSQLHQLRGRAGRGSQQAYCFLVSDSRSEKTIERMKVIVNHQNGQEIAEEDYRLRGPGDYFGSRQHGFPDMKALDPYVDGPLIAQTRAVAAEMLSSGKAEMIAYRADALQQFYHGVEIGMN